MNRPITNSINKRLILCAVALGGFASFCSGADTKPHTVCIDHDALPPRLWERIESLLQATDLSVVQVDEKDGEADVARIDIARNSNYYDIEIVISGRKVAEEVGVSGQRLPYLLLDRLRTTPSRLHEKSPTFTHRNIRLKVISQDHALGFCDVLDADSGISIGRTNSEGVVVIAARPQLPLRLELRIPNSSFLTELCDYSAEQTIDVGTLPNPSEATVRKLSTAFRYRAQFENNVIISKINRESQKSVHDGTPDSLAALYELGETLENTRDVGRQEWSNLQRDFEKLRSPGHFSMSDSAPLPSTKGWPNFEETKKRTEYNRVRHRIEAMLQRRDFGGIDREFDHFQRLAHAAKVEDEAINKLSSRVRAYRDTSVARRTFAEVSNAEYREFASRCDELISSVKTIVAAGDKWGASEAIEESVDAISTIKSELNRVKLNSAVDAEKHLKLVEHQLEEVARCVQLLERIGE